MGQTAERAADFVNSFGVSLHTLDNGSSYWNNEKTIIQDMAYLGLYKVRDIDPGSTSQANLAPFEQLAAAGIKFDFVLNAYEYPVSGSSVSGSFAFLNAMETTDPGSVIAVEGPNEVNSYSQYDGYSGLAIVIPVEQAIQQAVTSDPLLKGVSIYALTTLDYAQVSSIGDLSPYVTYGNAHIYAQTLGPEGEISWLLPIDSKSTPGLPMVVTETGYNTDIAATVDNNQYGPGVSQQVQAKYTLDLFFDEAAAGVVTTYLYELLDFESDPTNSSFPDHWGLFNADGSAKPVAVAIHNLTTILADNSATASSFTPGTLNYTVTGLPVYHYTILNGTVYENIGGNTYLLQKSNGAFDLAVWAEPEIVANSGADLVAAPSDVTVSFTQQYQTIEVFDALISTAPIEVLHNVSQVQLLVTDHPLIVEIEPNGTAGATPVQQQTVLTIAYTAANEAVNDNATLVPFGNVVVTDTQISGAEAASITLSGTNGPTDANGTLSGTGLTKMTPGVYNISAASPAALSAALQTLVFTPTPHEVAAGQTETTQLTLAVSDGTNVVGTTTTVVATAQETAPTIAGTAATLSITDILTAQPFSHFTITDPDYAAQETVTITLQGANGSATDANGTLSGSGLTKTGVGTYLLAANTPAAITAELDALVFTPTVAEVPTGQTVATTFALSVSDGMQTATNAATTVTAKATGPIFSGITGTAKWSEDYAGNPYYYLKVTDAQSSGSETATITVTDASGNITDANGTLSGSGLTKTGTGTYTITAASPTAMSTALEALVFTPTLHEVAPGQTVTTEVNLAVFDGVHTGSPYIPTTIVVTAQETPPTIVGSTVGALDYSDIATLQPFASIIITDPDFGSRQTVTILTLKDSNGNLTDANGALSGSGISKVATGTYTLTTNSTAAITAELESLVFTPTQVAAGQKVVTNIAFTDSDGVHTANSNVVRVVVAGQATTPAIAGVTASRAITDLSTAQPFGSVVITDSLSGSQDSVAIILRGADGIATDANGLLSGSGLTKTGTGTYSLAASTPAAITAELDSLVFTPTQAEVPTGQSVTTTFALAVTDGTTTATSAATTVTATAVGPVLGGAVSGQSVTSGSTVRPFSHVTLSDPYGSDSVTITLLSASGSATDANGILSGSGLTKTGTGTYILAAKTPAAITTELDSLVFTPIAAAAPVTTTFVLAVSDGVQTTVTNTATTVTTVIASGSGPTFRGITATGLWPDTYAGYPYFYLQVSDAHSSGSETATITLTGANGPTDANGLLSGSGLTKTGVGTYTISAASPAAMSAALEALLFTPTRHEVAPGQSVTTQFALTVSDGVYSGSPAPTTIIVTARDTPPGIAGTSAQVISGVATVQPFGSVVITDPDYAAKDSVTITLEGAGGTATDADGTLSGTGLTKTGTGTYSLAANTPAAITTELDKLVFTPAKATAPVITTFALVVADGASTATNAATTVTVKPLGPNFSGVTATAAWPESYAGYPYYFLNITDAQSSGSETATIKVIGANGSLTDANGILSGSGLTETATGTYTITAASPAAMSAALQALVFTPTLHEVAPGQTVTTQLNLAVSDGTYTGTPAIPTTIVATAQDTGATIAGTAGGQLTNDVSTVQPFGSVVITDPDYSAQNSVTITLEGAGGTVTDANGVLSGSGLTKIANGTYGLDANTPAAITTELDNLVFTPTTAEVTAGQSVTTTFVLAVSDGIQTVTNAATTVTATATAIAQSSSLTFISGQNNATIQATTGADVFTFGPATFGNDTIQGFNPAQDFLQISKTLAASFAAFQADETSVSGGTMVTLNASNSIFLSGVAPGAITSQHVALF